MYYLLKYIYIICFPATWISSWLSQIFSLHTFPTQYLPICIFSNLIWNLFSEDFFSPCCLETLAVYLLPQTFQDPHQKQHHSSVQYHSSDSWTERHLAIQTFELRLPGATHLTKHTKFCICWWSVAMACCGKKEGLRWHNQQECCIQRLIS